MTTASCKRYTCIEPDIRFACHKGVVMKTIVLCCIFYFKQFIISGNCMCTEGQLPLRFRIVKTFPCFEPLPARIYERNERHGYFTYPGSQLNDLVIVVFFGCVQYGILI